MPPTTAERLKVRCYRCNQLLAVAPNKAGAVVACPRCQAELLIPRPEPQQPAEEADPSIAALKSGTFPALMPVTESPPSRREGAESASFLDEIAAIIPPEVAALRPEDLRVEAEVFESITRPTTPTTPSPDDPFLFPGPKSAADFIPPAPTDEPAAPGSGEIPAFLASVGPAAGSAGTAAAPPPLPVSVPAPDTNVVVPPIRLAPEEIRPTVDAEPRGIREVVLPASVVLAWSLFVLSAIPMAFLAGLMIGHFLWKSP